MSSINFDDLQLQVNQDSKIIKIVDKEIAVKNYLSIDDKVTLVQLVLQQATDNDIYNSLLLEAYFNLYLVFFYTNLEFTDEQKENALDTYDLLESNGVIDLVINAIDKEEYEDLYNALLEQRDLNIKYQTSVTYSVSHLINSFNDFTKNLNEYDYQAIVDNVKNTLTEGVDANQSFNEV